MDDSNYSDVKIASGEKAKKIFRLCNELVDFDVIGPTAHARAFYSDLSLPDLFLMKIKCNNKAPTQPIQVGYMVLAQAKLKMVKMMYKLQKYCDDRCYQFCYSNNKIDEHFIRFKIFLY